jgi:N-acetylneuraminate synthase/sialic acid synthase
MRERYPECLIGFSSHHPGLVPIIIARTIGASIFEVHFTMNRGFRGTDHGFSIEPKGLAQLVEDVKRVSIMCGSGKKESLLAERTGFIQKMGKGIYLKTPQKAGKTIEISDISIKSPAGTGYKPSEFDKVVGKVLIFDTSTGVALDEGMFDGR